MFFVVKKLQRIHGKMKYKNIFYYMSIMDIGAREMTMVCQASLCQWGCLFILGWPRAVVFQLFFYLFLAHGFAPSQGSKQAVEL